MNVKKHLSPADCYLASVLRFLNEGKRRLRAFVFLLLAVFVATTTAKAELIYILRPVTGDGALGGVQEAPAGDYTITGNGVTTAFGVKINTLPPSGTTWDIDFQVYAAIVNHAGGQWYQSGIDAATFMISNTGATAMTGLTPNLGSLTVAPTPAGSSDPSNSLATAVTGAAFLNSSGAYDWGKVGGTGAPSVTNNYAIEEHNAAAYYIFPSSTSYTDYATVGNSASNIPTGLVYSGGTLSMIRLADLGFQFGSTLSQGTSTMQALTYTYTSGSSYNSAAWYDGVTSGYSSNPPSNGTHDVNLGIRSTGNVAVLTSLAGYGGLANSTAVTVSYSPPCCALSPLSLSNIRVMLGSGGSSDQTGSLIVSNSGGSAGTFQLSAGTGDALCFGLSGASSLAPGTTASSTLGWGNTSVTGSRSGQAVLTDLSPGDVGSPHAVSVTGAVVTDRMVTASPIALGRFISSSVVSGSSTLSTSGNDNDYTRITVNGTTFNSAATTGNYNLPPNTYVQGPVSGSVSLPVSGEGLAGEGTYAGVIVAYSGTSVQNRIVTSTSASFLIHLGQSFSQPITLSTTGLDNQYTRVSVNNAGPDGNGAAVSGGANPVFNGPAVSDTRTFSCTPAAAGVLSGTIALTTNGEGLAGESPVPVQVAYSGQVFSGNGQWSGSASIASWGVNANWTDTGAAVVHAAPGIWGLIGDSAILGAGTAGTITLDGANPSLAALTFNNTSGYTLAPGYPLAGGGGTLTMANGASPAAVTVAAGSHSIAVPMVLNSNTNLAVSNPGNALTISGPVTGAGGLTKVGSGTLVLAGNCSYSGSTTITAGLLQVNNNGALGPGTSALTLNGGTLSINQGGLVSVASAVNDSGGSLVLNGGTIRARVSAACRWPSIRERWSTQTA